MNNANTNNGSAPLSGSNGGRNVGSRNRLTREARGYLFEAIKDDLKKLDRLLSSVHSDERILHLKHFAKILTRGNDEYSDEVKQIMYEQLLPHFKKMNLYFPHTDPNKKISELRQFLKLLNPNMIEEIVKDMSTRQKIDFSK